MGEDLRPNGSDNGTPGTALPRQKRKYTRRTGIVPNRRGRPSRSRVPEAVDGLLGLQELRNRYTSEREAALAVVAACEAKLAVLDDVSAMLRK